MAWRRSAAAANLPAAMALVAALLLLLGSSGWPAGWGRAATPWLEAALAALVLLALTEPWTGAVASGPRRAQRRRLGAALWAWSPPLLATALVAAASAGGGLLAATLGTHRALDWRRELPLYLLVAIATSWAVVRRDDRNRRDAGFDRLLDLAGASTLAGVVLAQALLGGAQRTNRGLLLFHLLTGVTVLLPVALHVSLRGMFVERGPNRPLAMSIGFAVLVQAALGAMALLVPGRLDLGRWGGVADRALVVLHQAAGLVLLALAAALLTRLAGAFRRE